MTEMNEMTIGDVLDDSARRNPGKEAVVYADRDVRLTYQQFRDACDQAARGLMRLGIEKGDHVTIWATSVPEWLITQYATAKIGAVLVTCNPAYRAQEFEYLMKQSDTKALIFTQGYKDSNYVHILHEVCPELKGCKPDQLKSEALPLLKNAVFVGEERHPGMLTWADLSELGDEVSQEDLAKRQASLDPGDVINIQYTSGTTGFPKGAMLTHSNLLMNALSVSRMMKITEEDKFVIPVPLYHCFGCVLGSLVSVLSGSTMVPIEVFDPLGVLKAIHQEKCTVVYGVPTMFLAELGHPDFEKFDLRSLRTGIMAGAPCPVELMKKVVHKMGVKEMTVAYGQTETSPAITQTSVDDDIETRVSTVGKALPGVEVKIVDPATGEELPRGVQGELWARGHNVMKGYYKMPEATAKTVDSDGWIRTGDLGTMDESGCCNITGRLKDMIIRGGENVYPREIEELLYGHPKIVEAQVVGIPSEKYGEEVMAWVKLREGQTATQEEIRAFCECRIAGFKVPKYIKFVTDFPMTVTGKIQKVKMRELSIKELNLEREASVKTL